MSEEKPFASIADGTKPNAGRIYDFVLGGSHNFEVDRQAAQFLFKQAPFLPKLARTIRWFLGYAVNRLCEEGFRYFLDFASGLPTIDHIHMIAPKGTKIIYSDVDPVTVAYGQELLKNNPDVRYTFCNAGKPEDLLGSEIVSQFFGKNRRVAIGFNGIAFFLSDEELSHAMKVLYEWADQGSRLFICDSGFESNTVSPALQETFNLYEKIGQPMTFRSVNTLKKLIDPWKVCEPGFQPLEKWIDLKSEVAEETWKAEGMSHQGAILEKRAERAS
jgi:hypothetical protein